MRTLRNLAATATAVCSALSVFFHFLGLGAFFGAVLCAYLWRAELWVWLKPKLKETWWKFLKEWHRP